MLNRRHVSFLLAAIFSMLLIATAHAADLSLGGMLTDHAVIQRDKPIAVWGKAAPGSQVTATLDKQSKTATADADGNWKVELPPLKAGGPYDLTVTSGDKTINLTDILIGDVWICSGQSNMQFAASGAINAKFEVESANFPKMRIFTVARNPSLVHVDEVTGNWQQVSPQTVGDFSAVGFFFGRELHQKMNIPIGLIDNSWGGMPAEAYTTRATLEADPDYAPILERCKKNLENYEKQLAAYEEAMKKPDHPKRMRKPAGDKAPNNPAALWNGMTEPISPYAIKGVIWYQGESNAGRAYQYRKLFSDMIGDWRKLFGADMPFLFVQLANFHQPPKEPGQDSSWAELREAQDMALKLPNTAVGTAIDVGDAKNIHPKDKQTVAHRLALGALAIAYGQKVVYQGPQYSGITADGNTLRVKFTHTDGGLKAKGDKLTGFVIAGEDQKWHWADAQIDGDSVIVSSPDVAKPVAVRYGWADNPAISLYNGEDLPALPFRSDDWPVFTQNNK